MTIACDHCGAEIQTPHDPVRNQAWVNEAMVCHPNDDGPDCYRLITVYRQPVGFLIGQREKWRGVHRIQSLDEVVAELGVSDGA